MEYPASGGHVLGHSDVLLGFVSGDLIQNFSRLTYSISSSHHLFISINTLLGKNVNRQGSNYEREYRGGGGPPKPPSNKRIGGLSSPKDAPGGGCASCAK